MGNKFDKLLPLYTLALQNFVAFVKDRYNLDLTYETTTDGIWEINFGGIYIHSDEDLTNGKFSVSFDTYDPATYWEPEDHDISEHSTDRLFADALMDVVWLHIGDEYNNHIMDQWAEEESRRYHERENKEKADSQDTEAVEE